MSETWNIQISPKLPDGTLVNLRAENPDQMGNLLNYIEVNAQAITSAIAVLTAAGNAANAGLTRPQQPAQQAPGVYQQGPAVTAPPQQWGQAQAPTQPQQQSGPAPTCRHGEMRFRPAGTSKSTGKPYKAFWSCSGPRNEQCDTQNAA